jgi:hypothetical protein
VSERDKIAAWDRLHTARPLSEWTEETGDVLWWAFPIQEPPYVGSPLDLGREIVITLIVMGKQTTITRDIGGWPGYHTHWTPLPSAWMIEGRAIEAGAIGATAFGRPE